MKYLYLNFKDAKIFHTDKNFTHPDIAGKVETEISQPDMENLIPLHCISGMLHYLCGLTPVPFKDKIGLISKNTMIDEAAKTTLIKYSTYYNVDEKNGYYKEIKNTTKAHKYNSHAQNTEVFDFATLNGEYTFERLKVNLGINVFYDKIMEFIRSIVPIEGKTHTEVWNELHKAQNEPTFATKKDTFISGNEDIIQKLDTNFKKLIFNIGEFVKSSTTDYCHRRALFEQRGIGHVLSLSGSLIIEVNDDIVKLINEGPMTATLLDGGLVTITNLKNYIDIQTCDEPNWRQVS